MSWLRELPRMGQRLWRSRQNKAQGKRSEGPRSPGYKSQIISEALKERQKNPLEQTLFCRPFGALCYSFHLLPGLRGLFRPLTPGFDLQPFQGCLSSGFATAPLFFLNAFTYDDLLTFLLVFWVFRSCNCSDWHLNILFFYCIFDRKLKFLSDF